MALDATEVGVLFDQVGKSLRIGDVTDTATKTTGTIAVEVEDLIQAIAVTQPVEIHDAVSGAPNSTPSLVSAGQSNNTTAVQTPSQNLIIQTVKADTQLPDDSALTAVKELIRQMAVVGTPQTLNANEPTVSTIVYGPDFDATSSTSDNNGDGIFNASTKRGDGLVNEHILGEDIEGSVTSILATGQASMQFKGELSTGLMSPDWPKGFGGTTTLTSFIGASGTNLVNGSFEAGDTNEADLPSGWVSVVGFANIGTTLNLTPVEVQTITVTGTPTSGYYVVTFTDKDSNTQDTASLVFDASAAALQSALRNLNGLGSITITATGTSPNLTHTITMTGVTNPGQFTIAEATDLGTYTPATTVAGNSEVMRGARSVQFTGNGGAELTSIAHPVILQPATVYALSAWLVNDGALVAGAMNIGLFDSAASGASAITNDQGVSQEFSSAIDLTALTTTFTQQTVFFQTPTIMPDSLFLRVRMTTAITSGENVFMDELVMVPATELYPGGPYTALFTGPTDWVVGDEIRFSPANDQQGRIHTWMNRVFNLGGNRLLFGSALAGGETIADSKIDA